MAYKVLVHEDGTKTLLRVAEMHGQVISLPTPGTFMTKKVVAIYNAPLGVTPEDSDCIEITNLNGDEVAVLSRSRKFKKGINILHTHHVKEVKPLKPYEAFKHVLKHCFNLLRSRFTLKAYK